MLDLGCGGGWEILRQKASYLIGIDISLPALKKAKRIYDEVILSDVRYLPIRNCSLDCLISIDVLGHIPKNDKDRVLNEIARVLKDYGYTIHLVETDGQGVIPNFLKKIPQVYWKYMVCLDGHIGLESPETVLSRFAKLGNYVKVRKFSSGLFWPVASYLRRLNNDECMKILPLLIRILIIIANFSIRSHLSAFIDCVFGLLSRIYDALTPLNAADCIYLILQKRKEPYFKRDG
jgi:SAM-dependent methyltransferase